MLSGKHSAFTIKNKTLLDVIPSVSLGAGLAGCKEASFCYLTSIELIHIPNCNIMYVDYNFMDSFKVIILK